jgi:hypothetical protein
LEFLESFLNIGESASGYYTTDIILIPKYLENLINFRITREQWSSLHRHFGENTTHRPHINGGGIMTRTQKDFRCSIPEGYDLTIISKWIYIEDGK